MSKHVDRASRWMYRGIWAVLVRWFKVPDQPPTLPIPAGETIQSFRPSEGFLRYLKFLFWIGLTVIDVAILFGWVALTMAFPVAGAILALPALFVAIAPDILAYIAIHLRYDSTWYVMTSRSLRIRRGIWLIHETTITFENVQNVEINQGPLQRYFGIADVRVDTAGGGGEKGGKHGNIASAGHRGLIEGIGDAVRIRDLILARLKQSKKAGLGDEPAPHEHTPAWTDEHVAVLREIRDLVRAPT
jgi:membrane protein YdbS with pleckstrin-like domain